MNLFVAQRSNFLLGPVAETKEADALSALVRRAQAGDSVAERELIVAYQRRMAGFVYAVRGRSQDVDDLCQRIFIRMIRAIGSLRDPAQFEPWLFRIARHVCIDDLRHEQSRPRCVPILAHHAEMPEPSGRVDSEELDALRHALAQLSEKERVLLALAQEGRSYQEISRILSINICAAKARVHRARLHLRAHYQTRR
jgi:RNA polymerase sigma-70 factor (ECF subfamily)